MSDFEIDIDQLVNGRVNNNLCLQSLSEYCHYTGNF